MKLRMVAVTAVMSAFLSLVGTGSAGATPPPSVCEFPCIEDFDDGVFDHSELRFTYVTNASGSALALPNLWHVSSACGDAPSPPNYLAFNQDATCDYAEGVRTAGGVRLTVDLSGTPLAFLRFREYLDVEPISSFDRPSVRASGDGVNWLTLMDPSYARPRGWRTMGLDLSPLAGDRTVYIEWSFDTVDRLFNSTLGWLIDDVRIDANPLCSGNDARSSACRIRMLPYGNHQSTSGFTVESGEIAGCGLSGTTAWYRYTHDWRLDALMTIDTRGSSFDTVIAVFDGEIPLGCNDEHEEGSYIWGRSNPQAVHKFPMLSGHTYHIQIGGYQGAVGSLLVEMRVGLEWGI